MIISDISKYKGSVYEIELDEEKKIYLHADIVADHALRKGSQISSDELEDILKASDLRRAYQFALYRLDYRAYSRKEMFGKLMKTYNDEELCTSVVDKLEKLGMINDEQYAAQLARTLVKGRKHGRRRAEYEMHMKGLDRDIIEDALEEYCDVFEENLMELIYNKYADRLSDPHDRREIEKAKASLARLGYNFGEINHCIRQYFDDLEEED